MRIGQWDGCGARRCSSPFVILIRLDHLDIEPSNARPARPLEGETVDVRFARCSSTLFNDEVSWGRKQVLRRHHVRRRERGHASEEDEHDAYIVVYGSVMGVARNDRLLSTVGLNV
jgi:hypothetical protein